MTNMREKIGDDTNPKEEGKVDDLSIFLFPSPCFFSTHYIFIVAFV
jgi:hypothetical protein